MLSSTFRANASRIEVTGNWSVQCLRCDDSIGTMTSDTLRDAVFRTAHRGGVICPNCRASACVDCGDPLTGPRELPDPKLCVLCELERAIKGKTLACTCDSSKLEGATLEDAPYCPVCDPEGAVWELDANARSCLSSISYLKPEKGNSLPLSNNVPPDVLEDDDLTDEYIAAMWEDEVPTKKDGEIDTEFIREMKRAGYSWLDENKAISTGFCLDGGYVYALNGERPTGGDND